MFASSHTPLLVPVAAVPSPPPPASYNAAVCTTAPVAGATWHPFRLPAGLDYLKTAHPEVVERAKWAPPSALATAATLTSAITEKAWPALGSGALRPTECVPSETWYTCFACRGSTLERPCNGTVGHYRAHGLCYHQKNKKRLAGRSPSLC